MSDAVMTLSEAAQMLSLGAMSSLELTRSCLERIERLDPDLGAFRALAPEEALEAAARADVELARGEGRGPLHGIPLGIKDLIATRSLATTANSRVLPADWGQGIDAPVVRRLRDAGAVIIGKTTTSEFGFGLPDPELESPIPLNPWDITRTPSGSSAGNGVAVATGMVFGAIGTDTAGSIRAPSAANGITGLKPTLGLVPTAGVVPLAPSLDTVGPMARSSRDCALLFDAIAGTDSARGLSGEARGIRIGLPTGGWADNEGIDERRGRLFDEVTKALVDAGADVVSVALPHRDEAWHANTLIWLYEAFAAHRNTLGTRWRDYGRSARITAACGAFVSRRHYAAAIRMREIFAACADDLLSAVHLLLTPYFLDSPAPWQDEQMTDLFAATGFSCQWNLTGHPALVFPCGTDENGMPFAMQLIGPRFGETTLLRAADALQVRTDWHLACPPMLA